MQATIADSIITPTTITTIAIIHRFPSPPVSSSTHGTRPHRSLIAKANPTVSHWPLPIFYEHHLGLLVELLIGIIPTGSPQSIPLGKRGPVVSHKRL